jgi:DNA-binding response OmpR family regulator/two-component sensor histidine kinase
MYEKASHEEKNDLKVMMRNGQRLLRLINQVLDLSKIEAGKMTLQAAPVDIVQWLREILASYQSFATDRKIKCTFYPEIDDLLIYIDHEKLEKVLHNILSNAFKFTEAGGDVVVHLKKEEDRCFITIKDTGIGIPVDQLDKVFDRFYQVNSAQTREYEGSGLGMALAKELVELHKGSISIKSAEGKGTTVTVSLRLGTRHLEKGEISEFTYNQESETLSHMVVSSEASKPQNEDSPTTQPVVLIVEDNADMRDYIRKTLSDRYNILEARDGKTGLDLAQQSIPDLIISDVMMPQMDGFQLCSLLKTNKLTSHIPVILLTAKADRESRLSGRETGADDYLSKPFDVDELRLIVMNHIEERRKLRERFSRQITLEPIEITISSLDEKFLEKVLAIIEQHMDDEHFSIDELSREAGFSNMQFYRKIKGLSGQTPSEFLRTIRLKRAAALLAKNSDNVTQIAYSVGFKSLSYFNKCFKEQFGVTPGQYAEVNLKPRG